MGNLSQLKEVFDPTKHQGINLTGFSHQTLHSLGFKDVDFIVNKDASIEDESLELVVQALEDFRRVFVVLPHYRPCIPYVLLSIIEITGQAPVIVFLKQQNDGSFLPNYMDTEEFRYQARSKRRLIREKVLTRKSSSLINL